MNLDPRDIDSRDATSDSIDHDDDLRPLGDRDRDDDAREPGRGPGESRQSHQDGGHARDDARWPEREHSHDPREVFARDLNLPRGHEREIVRDRDREYTLRGSESRPLATVAAFRVVSSRDLRDDRDRPLDPRTSDLRHLREQRLVETVPDVYVARADLFNRAIGVLRKHAAATPQLTLSEAAERYQTLFCYRGRPVGRRRLIGTTLLVKGLEFHHAIVLDAQSLSRKELYVALTRGARSLTVISTSRTLNPLD